MWWITAGCLAACQGRGSHLKTTRSLMDIWQASETSHSKATWSSFSTNICMNCHVMCTAIIWWRKVCLPVVRMEGGFSQIQSHMNNNSCRSCDLQILLWIKNNVKLPWFDPKCSGLMANSFKEMAKYVEWFSFGFDVSNYTVYFIPWMYGFTGR